MKFISEKSRLLDTIQAYIDDLGDLRQSQDRTSVQNFREDKLIRWFRDEIKKRINDCYDRYQSDLREFWNNKRWWQSSRKAPKIESYRVDIIDLSKTASRHDIAIIPFNGFIVAESLIFRVTGIDERDTNLYSIINTEIDNINIDMLFNNIELDNPRVATTNTHVTSTNIIYIGNIEFVRENMKHGYGSNFEGIIKDLQYYYDYIQQHHSDYIEYDRNDKLYYILNEAKSLIEYDKNDKLDFVLNEAKSLIEQDNG